MGFLDGIVNKAKSSVASKLPIDNRQQNTKLRNSQTVNGILQRGILGKTYNIEFDNWYKSLPYGFRFVPRDTPRSPLSFYLPIAPQNISVRTPFATNVVSTMYGTVEEHSEIRYHDIVISGTTGMVPRFSQIFDGNSTSGIIQSERENYEFEISNSISRAAGGFFSRTLESINSTINNATSTLGALTATDRIESGVNESLTGFAAFHNFFRFLIEYKRDAAGVDSTIQRREHPLKFLNYKDGIMYDCAIRDFSLNRSATDPLLYYYSITMRCYNLRTIDKEITDSAVLQQRFEQLGLDRIDNSSAFSRMSGLVGGAKNTVASVIGGLSGFGG